VVRFTALRAGMGKGTGRVAGTIEANWERKIIEIGFFIVLM